MFQQLRTATLVLIVLTILTGVLYPLGVTFVAQLAFPHRASGSLMQHGDRVIGSELIGQSFSRPEHFWGRLSATSPVPYNAAASAGSNFGPLHPDLKKAAAARIAALGPDALRGQSVPVDLVTASASGLDPHISPAAAEVQVPRIAVSRKMSEDDVRDLVRRYTESRQYGILGEPRVNVLKLNIALDHPQEN